MSTDALIDAVRTLNTADGFRPRFDGGQWRAFALALQAIQLRPGEALIRAGETDRTVFFIGQGNLQIFVPGGAGAVGSRRPVTLLRPGAVVGEAALFADLPRQEQVEAVSQVQAFGLTRARFQEISLRQPALAVEILRALGAVMVGRVASSPAPLRVLAAA